MNGDPVLFGAVATGGKDGALYTFACPSCGYHYSRQPGTVCASCSKPRKAAKSPRRSKAGSR